MGDRGESILEASLPDRCLDVEEGLEWQAPSRKRQQHTRFGRERIFMSSSLSVRGEQFPVSLGDDFDDAVGHFDGGLIINRI